MNVHVNMHPPELLLHPHSLQERFPDLQAEQEARAAEYRAEQKSVKREQERQVRVAPNAGL